MKAVNALNAPAPQGASDTSSGRLLGLSWAHFLNDGAANYLPGILPAVLIALHEPVRMAGALMAALVLGQALQPLAGWLSDRLGGRSLMISGLLASSLGGALIGMARQTWVLIALLLLTGAGSALFHPQALAGVRTMVGSRTGFLTSAFLVGGELGRGVWPTAASLIGDHLGLRSLWIVALPALITAPLLARWAPTLAPRPRGASIRWRVHRRPMALLIGYRSARAMGTYGLVTFIPVMWHVHGGTLVGGASIITTMLLVGVVGNLSGGYLADKLGRRPVLLVSAVAMAALIPLVGYVPGHWIWVTAGVLGVAMMLTASTTVLIGQDIFPENRSMGSGIALGLANGIGALLIMVIGFWVTSSDVVTVFWVLAAASLLSVIPAAALPERLMS